MRILVLGSGGREHAICWKLSQSPIVNQIYCAPGNGGTALIAKNVNLGILNNAEILEFVWKNNIDLTIVGPEAPLVNGIVDEFEKREFAIFGPKKAAAMLEGSKAFSKEIMKETGIPTGKAEVFLDANSAIQFIKKNAWARVIKADGLAGGKGVYVCSSEEEAIAAVNEIMLENRFGDAGKKILVEEKLIGEEASFLVFSDGNCVKPMIVTQDHKPAFDGDKGPNTGGMGAYGPAPILTSELQKQALEQIAIPTVQAMKKRGTPYKGVLYCGLMITPEGLKLLEYNCRFGDPECQPIMALLKNDLLPIIMSCVNGTLNNTDVNFRHTAACCVVLASGGYPNNYQKGKLIKGLDSKFKNALVFHAGTTLKDKSIYTEGGRVLGVTGLGFSIEDAIKSAYAAVGKISFENMQYRKDIGAKAIC